MNKQNGEEKDEDEEQKKEEEEEAEKMNKVSLLSSWCLDSNTLMMALTTPTFLSGQEEETQRVS